MKIVDTHQHLWDKDLFRYAWLEPLPKLDRSFRLSDYRDATSGLEIDKTVFVECDVDETQMIGEALHVLRMADDFENRIAGIIASGRPERDDFKAHLTRLAAHPKVKGLRRILHTSPDQVGLGERFLENVSRLKEYGLSFDICVLARQLPVAINLVSKCPDVTFILDHCGVPDVKGQALDPWREHIRELSKFPDVACKISGLVAYADPANWKADDLVHSFEHIIESFGWDRVMFGSDWPGAISPPVTQGGSRRCLLSPIPPGKRISRKLFRENAIHTYRLE